ncbi:transposase [Celerinatantimonas yamalensis]|uniref:Transposase n=1 Tax=Celerinatantimonas yamalensis TaxID=559956 RepID=A0ABW9G719_9GAMM
MSSQHYPAEFKDEAVQQVLKQGYTVAEVRLYLKALPLRA